MEFLALQIHPSLERPDQNLVTFQFFQLGRIESSVELADIPVIGVVHIANDVAPPSRSPNLFGRDLIDLGFGGVVQGLNYVSVLLLTELPQNAFYTPLFLLVQLVLDFREIVSLVCHTSCLHY